MRSSVVMGTLTVAGIGYGVKRYGKFHCQLPDEAHQGSRGGLWRAKTAWVILGFNVWSIYLLTSWNQSFLHIGIEIISRAKIYDHDAKNKNSLSEIYR